MKTILTIVLFSSVCLGETTEQLDRQIEIADRKLLLEQIQQARRDVAYDRWLRLKEYHARLDREHKPVYVPGSVVFWGRSECHYERDQTRIRGGN